MNALESRFMRNTCFMSSWIILAVFLSRSNNAAFGCELTPALVRWDCSYRNIGGCLRKLFYKASTFIRRHNIMLWHAFSKSEGFLVAILTWDYSHLPGHFIIFEMHVHSWLPLYDIYCHTCQLQQFGTIWLHFEIFDFCWRGFRGGPEGAAGPTLVFSSCFKSPEILARACNYVSQLVSTILLARFNSFGGSFVPGADWPPVINCPTPAVITISDLFIISDFHRS